MKAVFDTKPTSIYDDEVTQHYQFPRQYLDIAKRCVGDRIVLRRPRDAGGNLAYFATSIVSHLERDPANPSMTFAHFTDFMQFERPVSWTVGGRYFEERLRNIQRKDVGRTLQGKSVREISESDFADIVAAGLVETLSLENAERLRLPPAIIAEAAAALHHPPPGGQARAVAQVLSNRLIRDASFRDIICVAYDSRCAVTKLRIFDGGNNPEVVGAHIWPVASGGPDVVQNGLALSGTVHWLFDRHLISIDEDYRLLVADKVPAKFQAAFSVEGTRLHLPAKREEWPHPSYIGRHRAIFAAKNGR